MKGKTKLPLVVLISGSGSNLQAIIDAVAGGLPAAIRAVISNQPAAYGLQRARQAGIPTRVLDHRDFSSREDYDRALADLVDSFHPQLIVLAGFMRILTADFVRRYHGRMLNIHPSLLPNYRGLHTHERVLQAGDREHGASVHYVTEELDGGPLVLQARVPVLAGDDADTLAARVLTREHLIYPKVIRWIAEGRLNMGREGPVLDGRLLLEPVTVDDRGTAP